MCVLGAVLGGPTLFIVLPAYLERQGYCPQEQPRGRGGYADSFRRPARYARSFREWSVRRPRKASEMVEEAAPVAPAGGVVVRASPVTTATPGAPDLCSQIARLGELRDQGLLDDEEFAAAKRKLLVP